MPGWRVLGINALLLGSDLPEAAEQEVAIAQAMQGLGLRSLALFLHKPLFDQTAAESKISNRFLTPGQRGRLSALLGIAPALVVSGHIHQYRSSDADGSHHVWGPSTAFVVSERIQPIYGLKEVGYVEHTLRPDGTHDSHMVKVPGARTLNIDDLPRLLLAAPRPAPAGRAGCRASCGCGPAPRPAASSRSTERSAPTAMPFWTAGRAPISSNQRLKYLNSSMSWPWNFQFTVHG